MKTKRGQMRMGKWLIGELVDWLIGGLGDVLGVVFSDEVFSGRHTVVDALLRRDLSLPYARASNACLANWNLTG
jgi:hypothetical protein